MNALRLKKAAAPLRGCVRIPGDKSISHRALMLGAIAEGPTEITGLLESADCLATMDCFRKMGISIEGSAGSYHVAGAGLRGLKDCMELDAQNSGTTTRLLSGILAGQQKAFRITGDASLCRRPMRRILDPLSAMGASVVSENDDGCAPLLFSPSVLSGIRYETPVASAQVKSCILLAGLYAKGETTVLEPAPSRDHTERMLRAFGADLSVAEDGCVRLRPGQSLRGQRIDVCADISSAAFWMAAALLVPGSELLLEAVNTNPTRDGMLRVLIAMGADIQKENEREVSGEPVADLLVRHSTLHGTEIGGSLIPALIDELPMLAVLAAFSEGETVIRDASELRVKESDRIESTCRLLAGMGASVVPAPDGMTILSGPALCGTRVKTGGDHRLAMAAAIAALACEGTMEIDDPACCAVSYPTFFDTLKRLSPASFA